MTTDQDTQDNHNNTQRKNRRQRRQQRQSQHTHSNRPLRLETRQSSSFAKVFDEQTKF